MLPMPAFLATLTLLSASATYAMPAADGITLAAYVIDAISFRYAIDSYYGQPRFD